MTYTKGDGLDAIPRKLKNYVSPGMQDIFDDWILSLKDRRGRMIIRARLDRVARGNFGDYRSVGAHVYELKIDFGPGYRVYYAEDGPFFILLLGGGDKSSQQKDIRRAQECWQEYKNRI